MIANNMKKHRNMFINLLICKLNSNPQKSILNISDTIKKHTNSPVLLIFFQQSESFSNTAPCTIAALAAGAAAGAAEGFLVSLAAEKRNEIVWKVRIGV